MVKKLMLFICLPIVVLLGACSTSSSEQAAVVDDSDKVMEVFRAPT